MSSATPAVLELSGTSPLLCAGPTLRHCGLADAVSPIRTVFLCGGRGSERCGLSPRRGRSTGHLRPCRVGEVRANSSRVVSVLRALGGVRPPRLVDRGVRASPHPVVGDAAPGVAVRGEHQSSSTARRDVAARLFHACSVLSRMRIGSPSMLGRGGGSGPETTGIFPRLVVSRRAGLALPPARA